MQNARVNIRKQENSKPSVVVESAEIFSEGRTLTIVGVGDFEMIGHPRFNANGIGIECFLPSDHFKLKAGIYEIFIFTVK